MRLYYQDIIDMFEFYDYAHAYGIYYLNDGIMHLEFTKQEECENENSYFFIHENGVYVEDPIEDNLKKYIEKVAVFKDIREATNFYIEKYNLE